MSCPTCDHTMQSLMGIRLGFWCPRCGTILEPCGQISAPALVQRCRNFASQLGPPWFQLWVMLGIEESILTPGVRRALAETPARPYAENGASNV